MSLCFTDEEILTQTMFHFKRCVSFFLSVTNKPGEKQFNWRKGVFQLMVLEVLVQFWSSGSIAKLSQMSRTYWQQESVVEEEAHLMASKKQRAGEGGTRGKQRPNRHTVIGLLSQGVLPLKFLSFPRCPLNYESTMGRSAAKVRGTRHDPDAHETSHL